MDYLLSQEGQQAWIDLQGSYSARKDVIAHGLPNIATVNFIHPKDMEDYASAARHQEFFKLWNQITGFK